jgi:pimeloyl-ACP methyl ester carboxylesterase
MWQVLAEVRCPILEVRGTRSDMFAAETAEQVKKTNPNLTLVEVDAGHNVAGDNPQALLSAVRPFLA